MPFERALISSLRCASCQSYLLRRLFSIPEAVRLSPLAYTLPQRRTFSSAKRWRSGQVEQRQNDGSENRPNDESTVVDDTGDTRAQPSVPWYLEAQTPEPAVNPFAERQRLPDLPEDSPSVLSPLLKQISVELGLDYVTLLDLRGLDPPPALGANLIMVFGSARGEKHLNVSADRLCRWLRSDFKLTPHADGLLGRNELKLKLRRKARRSKMLGAVGAQDTFNMDDGTRTGWVCVDVGTVPGALHPTLEQPHTTEAQAETEDARGFIGFGGETGGVRIVVQMMTEEKRGEIDLESLWQGILHRAKKRRAKELEESDSPENGTTQALPGSVSKNSGFAQTAYAPTLQHVRRLHTSSRRTDRTAARVADPLDHPGIHPRRISQQAEGFSSADKALSEQIEYLKRLPRSVAVQILGYGQDDLSSTMFLGNFYQTFPTFPTYRHWHSLIELQCIALQLRHPGYTKERALKLLSELEQIAAPIAAETFLLLYVTLLSTPHSSVSLSSTTNNAANQGGLPALDNSLSSAFTVLERMEAHGYTIVTEPILLELHKGVLVPPPIDSGSQKSLPLHSPLPSQQSPEVFSRLPRYQFYFRRALAALHPDCSDGFYMTMLAAYYEQDKWPAFWDVFRALPRLMRPRPPEMYALMFAGVARSKNQAHCITALETWVPELEREKPIVELKGAVAAAVMECIVEAGVPITREPWKGWWNACQMV